MTMSLMHQWHDTICGGGAYGFILEQDVTFYHCYFGFIQEDTTKEELVTQKEEIEFESTQSSTTAKIPVLKQVAETTTNDFGTLTTLIPGPVTIEEKAKKKNDVKARKTRFGRNEVTKKPQKSLLKKLYEIFSAAGTDLAFEWYTHVVVWRNKSDLDTMSLDDLYNKFNIVKQEVRRTTNINIGFQNIDFVSSPSPSSTNEVPADFGVSTASPRISTANLSDATVYAFLANQPNGSQLVHEDLEQIHEDDLEEMDLKWKLALLNGAFRKRCRVSRNQENRTRNQETTRRTVNVEDTSSTEIMVINGADFDWSYMADDEAPTNMTFMALLDSEVYTDNTCFKTCLKNYATLKTQYDELRVEFNKSKCNLADYKRGLASVEEQLVHYQMNESLLNENIVVLKRDIKIKDSKIVVLKSKLEKISNEKDTLETKIKKFENASQSLDKLIGGQVTDNSKKGLGYVRYNVVPPSRTRRFSPLRIDLSHTGLLEFAEPSVQSYKVKPIEVVTQKSSVKISAPIKENNGNISYLSDFKEFDEGYVAFGGGAKGGKITDKGTIITATKDETSRILKSFVTEIENLVDKKVKIIKCDNGTEFKNKVINEFHKKDSKLPITFWADAVNTACYVQNRVLVVKPHSKTLYELFRSRTHDIGFMRHIGFHVTILNTLDHLGKFDVKLDEGFFVGYSTNSKAFRVYNTRTRKVKENLHIKFLENKTLIVGTTSNDFVGKGASFDARQSSMETGPIQDYILMPLWNDGLLIV
nr:hypothetical protein [Tanacetum cinerariifolium]